MAEAQEQPQAQAQPEPVPVSAAAEEPPHALPLQSLAHSPSQSLSQAAQNQEKAPEVQARAQSPPEADADASQQAHIRSLPTSLPDAAETIGLAVAQEQEPELAREQGLGLQVPLSHPYHTVDAPNLTRTTISISNLPNSSSATGATTTVATDQATTTSTTRASSADVNNDPQTQREQNGAAPSSTAMSNNPSHPSGHTRQPVNYQNPTAYATPGMSTAHYGYLNPASQAPDPYRANTNQANSAMALPSMRTLDPVQQQTRQQQHHMAMAMPVTAVPSIPGQQPLPYYGQQIPMGNMVSNVYGGLPPEALGARYALPPSGPGAVLANSRHKKEIKRRTKTGCLTCRKRRIKCDEQHPVCKNCLKSKRECLGYDPIFKNQQQHPTNIQPAPNNQSSTSSVPSNGPPTSGTAVPNNSPATTSQAPLPPVISSGAPSTTSFASSLAPVGNTANVKVEGLEYTTIDPALDSAYTTSSMSTSHFSAIKPSTPNVVDLRTPDLPHLRGGGPSFVPLYPSASHFTPPSSQQRIPAYSGIPAQKMKVHELVRMGGAAPPNLDSPLSAERLDEVKDLYEQVYAPGLEKFFETEWYIKPQGVNHLVSNTGVNEMLAGFLQSMAKTDTNDVASMQYSANLEFRVVWDLATLVYTSEYKINVGNRLPPSDDGSEARNRVAVFEALLSGDFLNHNPLFPPPENADGADYHRIREFKFWYWLAEFLRIKDAPSMDMTHQREQALGQIRDLLDGRENRDVLYSLAVIRALAPNFPPDFESTLPPHLDESDPKSKLAVARQFIQDESQVTGGTTNVVRRFSELAVRAFIAPGSNIARR
ncbi:hypothetical protein F5X99DRAFT_17302 [Biscogniauxia marginata]|nr:hypothetical protein F5X99DRAFT_17302 [Biscogniauxia marginata]